MIQDIEMKDSNNERESSITNNKNSSLPFIEKFRPSQISNIISHDEIIKTINLFICNKSIPHFLFYGPPGTGKTTCALAISHQLYGKDYKTMTLELNASDERGINIVRQKIKDFCGAIGNFNTNINKNMFKLVILDEADMMTSDAQNALRRIMEKYTKNSRFILVCNQVNKINMAIQSRCMKFRFNPLKIEQCIERLKEICKIENVYYDNENVLKKIYEIGKGDMRKILNLLEATIMASKNNEITEDEVYLSAGLPTKKDFIEILNKIHQNKKFGNIFVEINNIRINNGYAMIDLINELCEYIRHNKNLNKKNKMESFQLMEKLDYLSSLGGNEKILLTNFISIIRKYNIN
jgi:replication factor C subunit 3/5